MTKFLSKIHKCWDFSVCWEVKFVEMLVIQRCYWTKSTTNELYGRFNPYTDRLSTFSPLLPLLTSIALEIDQTCLKSRHTHLNTHLNTHTHTHTHTSTHTRQHTHLNTHTSTHTPQHTHLNTHTSTHTPQHIHIHLNTHTPQHTHFNTHTSTHTSSHTSAPPSAHTQTGRHTHALHTSAPTNLQAINIHVHTTTHTNTHTSIMPHYHTRTQTYLRTLQNKSACCKQTSNEQALRCNPKPHHCLFCVVTSPSPNVVGLCERVCIEFERFVKNIKL